MLAVMLLLLLVVQVLTLIVVAWVGLLLNWRCRRIERRLRIVHGDVVGGAEYRIKTADEIVAFEEG